MDYCGCGLLALGILSFIHFRETPPEKTVLRYTISPPENSTLNSFAISPDGRYLAVAAAVNGKRQLWLRAMDGLQFQPMPGTDDATFPFWSPDSRYIGFFAQLKLKKIAASGGPALSLCDAGIGGGATWSTEDVILFSTASLGGWLRRVKASGGVPSDVRKAKETYAYPTSLRGGRFLYNLAFASRETDGIYLSSLDGGRTGAFWQMLRVPSLRRPPVAATLVTCSSDAKTTSWPSRSMQRAANFWVKCSQSPRE